MERTVCVSAKRKKEGPQRKFKRLLLTTSALMTISSGCSLISDFEGYTMGKKDSGEARDSNELPTAGRGGPDSSKDAAVDGAETGTDAELDSGRDSSVEKDVGVDAELDSGRDAELDSGRDSSVEKDVGVDAELDSGRDAVVDAEVDAAEGGTDAGPEVCENAGPGSFDGLIGMDTPQIVGGYRFVYKGQNASEDAIFDIFCEASDAVVAADMPFPEGEITTLPVPADGMQIVLDCFAASDTAVNVEITVQSL